MYLPQLLRSSLERMVRDRVVRRRTARRFGGLELVVPLDSMLSLAHPRMDRVDPQLQLLAQRLVRAGDRVWDVGANAGLFAFAAAAAAGSEGAVLAIDADPWLATCLKRSARLNEGKAAPVDVLCSAVGDRAGVAQFAIASRGRASNALAGFGHGQAGAARYRIIVPMLPLDALLDQLPAPQMVKVDVEGAELLVLRGAARLLACRATWLVECADENAAALTACFAAAGYVLAEPDAEGRLREVPAAVWNTVAVPPERRDELLA